MEHAAFMPPLERALFTILAVMVPVWFVCVSGLSRQLRDRHRQKYEEMRLAEMWPRGLAGRLSRHNNTRPVIALFRFLLRCEDAGQHETDISRLSSSMRRVSVSIWVYYICCA